MMTNITNRIKKFSLKLKQANNQNIPKNLGLIWKWKLTRKITQ